MNTTNFEAEVISCCDMEYNLMCILGIDICYMCVFIFEIIWIATVTFILLRI